MLLESHSVEETDKVSVYTKVKEKSIRNRAMSGLLRTQVNSLIPNSIV